MRLLVIFYKGTCGYCHKLLDEPLDALLGELGADGFLFVDALGTDTNHNAFMDAMFDKSRGVPQTYLVDLDVKASHIGFQKAEDMKKILASQDKNKKERRFSNPWWSRQKHP